MANDLKKAFCPTGAGGGVDNSCSPTGGGGRGGSLSAADTESIKQKMDATKVYVQKVKGKDNLFVDYESPGSGGATFGPAVGKKVYDFLKVGDYLSGTNSSQYGTGYPGSYFKGKVISKHPDGRVLVREEDASPDERRDSTFYSNTHFHSLRIQRSVTDHLGE